MENNVKVPQKIKMDLLYYSAIPLLGVYTYIYIYIYIYIHTQSKWKQDFDEIYTHPCLSQLFTIGKI